MLELGYRADIPGDLWASISEGGTLWEGARKESASSHPYHLALESAWGLDPVGNSEEGTIRVEVDAQC